MADTSRSTGTIDPGIEEIYQEKAGNESFRDRLSTVDEEGKRIWLFPKKPKGNFYRWRTLVSSLLILFLIGAPFVTIGGEPLLLFNVIDRKFVLFGQVFWPQDFHLFALGLISLVVFVVLFTVVFGRIFCGWICPQTIFMEMVFRRIEYWIEGDYMTQKKLNKQPWDTEKILKKSSKHLIFLLISVVIMHTFLAYIVGVDELQQIIAAGPAENINGFLAMVIFTGIFYWVFAFFREQVCTTVCPYGRFQGVLLDRNSMVVSYDHVRGEQRGTFRKHEDRATKGLGDCIDCKQCVFVCPTGIDIRNGTQLECVNCTACIDACDDIMDRIGRPRGLVRYASEQSIVSKTPFIFTARMKAYSAVMVILVVVLAALLIFRTEVESTILRTPGMTYQKREDGSISNLYNYKIVNKGREDLTITIVSEDPAIQLELVGDRIFVPAQQTAEGAFFLSLPRELIPGRSFKITLSIRAGEKELETVTTKFLAPG